MLEALTTTKKDKDKAKEKEKDKSDDKEDKEKEKEKEPDSTAIAVAKVRGILRERVTDMLSSLSPNAAASSGSGALSEDSANFLMELLVILTEAETDKQQLNQLAPR